MWSAMMMTLGVAHLLGSSPSVPTPRVTTSRTYPSWMPLTASVSLTALVISGFVMGIFSQMALAEFHRRSICSASRNTRPP